MVPPEKRTGLVVFRVAPAMKAAIERKAFEEDRPISEIVRRAVICYCASSASTSVCITK